MPTLRQSLALIAVVAVVAVLPGQVGAQQIPNPQVADFLADDIEIVQVDGKFQMVGEALGANGNTRNGINQQQATRQKHLDDLIADMRKVCGLSKGQVRKLQVAAKGAVHYSLEARHQQAQAFQQQAAGVQAQGQRLVMLNINNVAVAQTPSAAAKQRIWLKTVDKVLTDEQKATFERAGQHRLEAKQRELTDKFLTEMKAAVPNLTAAQIEAVSPIVKRGLDKLGKTLDQQQFLALDINQARQMIQGQVGGQLQKTLAANQLAQWNRHVQQRARFRVFNNAPVMLGGFQPQARAVILRNQVNPQAARVLVRQALPQVQVLQGQPPQLDVQVQERANLRAAVMQAAKAAEQQAQNAAVQARLLLDANRDQQLLRAEQAKVAAQQAAAKEKAAKEKAAKEKVAEEQGEEAARQEADQRNPQRDD